MLCEFYLNIKWKKGGEARGGKNYETEMVKIWKLFGRKTQQDSSASSWLGSKIEISGLGVWIAGYNPWNNVISTEDNTGP